MKVIGVTGGIGSGKSRVLAYMEDKFQVKICQADHVAWELQEPGKTCYKEIVDAFGTGVLNSDFTINRRELGGIVFADKEQLEKLNRIMHPAVKSEIVNRIQEEEQRGTTHFVLEAALLLEDNYQLICDEIWYIYCDETVRRARLKESRQYTDAKIDAIMSAQRKEDGFKALCQVVIDNSGEFKDTCIQIDGAMGQ